MKFAVHRTSRKEIVVEAATTQEAEELAYDAPPEKFKEIDYDWETFQCDDQNESASWPPAGM